MQRCWSVPAGARHAEALVVRVRLSLTREGTIDKGPFVVNRARLGDRYFKAAAESVLRALQRCQPFKMPQDKYEVWRELELNFDPSAMLG